MSQGRPGVARPVLGLEDLQHMGGAHGGAHGGTGPASRVSSHPSSTEHIGRTEAGCRGPEPSSTISWFRGLGGTAASLWASVSSL